MNGHGGKRPGAGRPKGAASRANEEVRQEAAVTGELPLAYMLRIMRDPSQPVGRRDEMAKAAAPFCHSRLSSVEHSGEISRPTVIRAPAVSATLDEWQAEYVPGVKERQISWCSALSFQSSDGLAAPSPPCPKMIRPA